MTFQYHHAHINIVKKLETKKEKSISSITYKCGEIDISHILRAVAAQLRHTILGLKCDTLVEAKGDVVFLQVQPPSHQFPLLTYVFLFPRTTRLLSFAPLLPTGVLPVNKKQTITAVEKVSSIWRQNTGNIEVLFSCYK